MLPLSKDLYINQGSDFETTFELRTKSNNSFDLSGYEISSYIKKYYNTEKVYNSVTEIIDSVSGVVQFNIPNEITSSMNAERYVYSIKGEKDGIVLTLVFGHILVERF